MAKASGMVSVPLFGDSFFMTERWYFMLPKFKLFPSPYSGILFLLADALGYDIVFKKFPSPYSGILFLYIL